MILYTFCLLLQPLLELGSSKSTFLSSGLWMLPLSDIALPHVPGNLGLTLCPGIKITIVLNHPNPNPYSKDHCDVQIIDDVVVAETVNSNGPANVRLKSCKVVLEDIIPKCVAEKLKTLNPPPEKTHKSDSCPTEGMFLQDLQARTPIAWGKMSDDRWAVLDSAVFGKLHPCQSLSKRVKLLEDSIYEEGAKIFGHSPSHHKNLSVTSRRTAHSISLIDEKNTLLRQIASMSNLVQKAALEQLLSQVKAKSNYYDVLKMAGRRGGNLKRHKLHLRVIHIELGNLFSILNVALPFR